MKIAKENTLTVKPDNATTVHIYPFKNDSYDIVKSEINGYHGRFKNTLSTKTYLVTRGEIEFEIEGTKYLCKKDDLFSIKPNKWHSMTGKDAEIILTCNPPYNPETEIRM